MKTTLTLYDRGWESFGKTPDCSVLVVCNYVCYLRESKTNYHAWEEVERKRTITHHHAAWILSVNEVPASFRLLVFTRCLLENRQATCKLWSHTIHLVAVWLTSLFGWSCWTWYVCGISRSLLSLRRVLALVSVVLAPTALALDFSPMPFLARTVWLFHPNSPLCTHLKQLWWLKTIRKEFLTQT